jgi:hypothetical protein
MGSRYRRCFSGDQSVSASCGTIVVRVLENYVSFTTQVERLTRLGSLLASQIVLRNENWVTYKILGQCLARR